MVTATSALISQINTFLDNEKKLDYSNGSFFGGFHYYLIEELQKLQLLLEEDKEKSTVQQLIEVLNDYPTFNIKEREEALRKVQVALESLIKKESSASLYPATLVKKAKLRASYNLDKPVKEIKQVGTNRARLLERLGIRTIKDLLFHFPRKYEDRTPVSNCSELIHGEVQAFAGTIANLKEARPRKKLSILKASIVNGSGEITAVWFNQSYLKKSLKIGKKIIVYGKVEKKFFIPEISVQEFELITEKELVHTNRIVPLYSLTEGLTQKFLRQLIFTVLDKIDDNLEETLPGEIIERYNFLPLWEAIKQIHFPASWNRQIAAAKRFVYEELFDFQLNLLASKKIFEQKKAGISHESSNEAIQKFAQMLPFKLTGAQKRVISEILKDMESSQPMSRLVQGDVGSGKTIVATFALLKAVDSGYQGALMAPTEILAEQHYLNLKKLFSNLDIKIGLLTGSQSKKEKGEILDKLRAGTIQVVVGTHALFQEQVEFNKLSLVIVDEQHRFGVIQRAKLQEKGSNPDVLVMTATPIPRTLALTLYGDLDVSVIDELPPGRQPVMTRFVPEYKREDAYAFIKQEIANGRQAYVICPLIEESEVIEAEAAIQLQQELQKSFFPEYEIGLLHGKLTTQEKEAIMTKFYNNEIPVLVSTTVVEVGVNVPNATIMVIEGVERFGLSQLHQLRGRVGRGDYKSYCFLFGNLKSDESKARVKILTTTNDGFQIAEEDLKLRGPGDFFGTRQHGLPEFKIANLLRDGRLIEVCRKDALEMLSKYPDLSKNHTLLI